MGKALREVIEVDASLKEAVFTGCIRMLEGGVCHTTIPVSYYNGDRRYQIAIAIKCFSLILIDIEIPKSSRTQAARL